MTHAEFVSAYRDGRVRASVDHRAAARFVSARLLLPLLLLPPLGIAVALALLGHLLGALALGAVALGLRFLVRASAGGFVLARALEQPQFYDEALAARVLRIEPGGAQAPGERAVSGTSPRFTVRDAD